VLAASIQAFREKSTTLGKRKRGTLREIRAKRCRKAGSEVLSTLTTRESKRGRQYDSIEQAAAVAITSTAVERQTSNLNVRSTDFLFRLNNKKS
jgi:hypothetical protein